MSCLGEKERNIIVVSGLSGVGKTTVMLSSLAYLPDNLRSEVQIITFGTLMYEVAFQKGLVKHRDELRKLPLSKQIKLQEEALLKLQDLSGGKIVLLDTHLVINTPSGILIGFPLKLIKEIMPSAIIIIEAKPEEIIKRRTTTIRLRDKQSLNEIAEQQLICKTVALIIATITGAIVGFIQNVDGRINEAAKQLAEVIKECLK